MAPQAYIPLAANILGTIGTVCWCVQLLPQIWRNYRTKSTEGLPQAMMLIWSISGVPFGIYAIAQNFNIPLIIQPQCFTVLCGFSWAQCLVYKGNWSARKATLLLVCLLLLFAGIEIGLVFPLKAAYARGMDWPVTLVGVVAFITLVSGYLPVPFELLKRRGRVVGIDFVFLAIDWSGAFFSLLALATQLEFDAIFGTMYALCCVIEMGMFLSHYIWYLRTRDLRRRAKAAGQTFEEYEEAVLWQAKGINLAVLLSQVFGRRAQNQSEIVDTHAQTAMREPIPSGSAPYGTV